MRRPLVCSSRQKAPLPCERHTQTGTAGYRYNSELPVSRNAFTRASSRVAVHSVTIELLCTRPSVECIRRMGTRRAGGTGTRPNDRAGSHRLNAVAPRLRPRKQLFERLSNHRRASNCNPPASGMYTCIVYSPVSQCASAHLAQLSVRRPRLFFSARDASFV